MKPRVSKQDGRWLVVRPGYGFNRDEVRVYDSQREALESLRSAPASAAADVGRGSYTLGLRSSGWSRRGTIRMEDT